MDKIWQCLGQTYFEAWVLRTEVQRLQGQVKTYEIEKNVKVENPVTPVAEVPTDVSE